MDRQQEWVQKRFVSLSIPFVSNRRVMYSNYRREQRLEIERRKKEADALKECSFAPSVKNAVDGTGKTLPRAISAGKVRSGKGVSSAAPTDIPNSASVGSSKRGNEGYFYASDTLDTSKTNGNNNKAMNNKAMNNNSGGSGSGWDLEETGDAGSSNSRIKVPIRSASNSNRGSSAVNANNLAAEEAMLTQQYAVAAARLNNGATARESSYPLSAEDLMDLMGSTDSTSSNSNKRAPTHSATTIDDYIADYSHTSMYHAAAGSQIDGGEGDYVENDYDDDDDGWDDPRIAPDYRKYSAYPPPPSSPPPPVDEEEEYAYSNDADKPYYSYLSAGSSPASPPPPPPAVPPTPTSPYTYTDSIGRSYTYRN
jgi:hypothetical protein